MWERRIFYLLTLLGGGIFWLVYQKWLAWFLLLVLLVLPLFSLLLSLPAMGKVKAQLRCPGITRMGVPSRSSLRLTCKLPAPPVSCKIRLVNELTGERYVGRAGELIPSDHCGKMTITTLKPVVYDYLGLFSRKLPVEGSCSTVILPKPVPGELPKYGKQAVGVLRPKPGGGVAEHHDLRLFRPGDEVRNIHWKLTAKTGKLIYREAMEPIRAGFVMTLALYGTPNELDRRLGQLLWCSRELLRQKQEHRVLCATGKGTMQFTINGEAALEEMLITLLSSPCAKQDRLPEAENAWWQHKIGGEADA
ncbi:MAG: DUF58 domain-containing protein [Oscillospiraceae bacterium]|nr:DUF58 domain-containing protein [Oscillospiraceae bacterium]